MRSQFGGSLFAMVDPFWMLLVTHQLGNDYYVWDKAGAIDFVAPGREDVYAHFKLENNVVGELRAAAASGEKVLRWFGTDVITACGEVIARVQAGLRAAEAESALTSAPSPPTAPPLREREQISPLRLLQAPHSCSNRAISFSAICARRRLPPAVLSSIRRASSPRSGRRDQR